MIEYNLERAIKGFWTCPNCGDQFPNKVKKCETCGTGRPKPQ